MTDEEQNKAIGQLLRMYREDAGMTQAKLAADIDIDNRNLCKYEQGINRTPAVVLINALFAMNVDAQVFCEDVYTFAP